MNTIIVDIETAPLDMAEHEALPEDERFKLLNPIDSRIVAIGLRHGGETAIFMDEDERKLLESFWSEFNARRMRTPGSIIVGFNILHFDIPFLTSRSFINDVQITPFKLKHVIDVREKLNAYRSGKSRGSLKDYARALGDTPEDTGSKVAEWWKEKKFDEIKKYLSLDLEMTEHVFERAQKLRIVEIEKW